MDIENVYHLPFDQYQRYRLIAEVMPILEGESAPVPVVEVGGYPPKLGEFLPGREITVVDRIPSEIPGYICAEAAALPFPDRAFGAAISLDTLEHILPENRDRFIAELCRAASSFVIVAAPFSSEAVKAADRAVFEFIRGHAGYEHAYLKQHLTLELPDLAATLALLRGHGLEVQVIPSGRLDRWLFMMTAYYTLDADPALQPALPAFMEAYNRAFYDFDKAEPAYRHFLIGSREPLGPRRKQLADLAAGAAAESPESRGLALVLELARTQALKKKDREMEALRAELKARELEVQSLRAHLAALEDFQRQVKRLPLYAVYEKFVKPRKS